jgi:hypothetical protein
MNLLSDAFGIHEKALSRAQSAHGGLGSQYRQRGHTQLQSAGH